MYTGKGPVGHSYRCTQNVLVKPPSFGSLSTYFLHLLLHRWAEKVVT